MLFCGHKLSHGQLSCMSNFLKSHEVLVIGHSETLCQIEMQLH